MSRLTKNIVYNLVGQGLVLLLGFWGTRLVFHQLGDEALGILYFALALNAVLTPLIDLGVSSTVIREVARSIRTDPAYVEKLARTTATFYWVSYFALTLAIWFIAPWLVLRWLHLKTLDPSVAANVLRLLAFSLLLMLPRSLYSNLLRGLERMDFNNLVDVLMTAIRQGGTIVVILRGGGIVEVAEFYLASFVLNVLAYLIAASRFLPWKAFVPGIFPAVVRQNFGFTKAVSAYTFLSMVQMESDKAIVSKLLPVADLGFYGVAQTMVIRANQIPGAVNQAAFPKLSALFHDGDTEGFRREYRRLQDLVCFSMVPVFTALIFVSVPLFTYLLNAQTARMLFIPTVLLSLGAYMNGTLNMPAVVSLAAGRPDIGARQNFYALFLVLPVTALLIWRFGLIGAGASFVFYHLYAYSYGARRVARECLGMRARDWYANVGTAVSIGCICYVPAWVLMHRMAADSVFAIIVALSLATCIYVAAAYAVIGDELKVGIADMSTRISGGMLRLIGNHS